MDGFVKFLWLLAKVSVVIVLGLVFFATSRFVWNSGNFNASNIAPPAWQQPTGQVFGGSEPQAQKENPDEIVVCNVLCAGKNIFTFAPNPTRAQCGNLLAQQGQRRCDAYAKTGRT